MRRPERLRLSWSVVAALLAFPIACGSGPSGMTDPLPDEATLREVLAVPEDMEVPHVPTYNVPTREKIELGRRLFYDNRLSGNQTQACATCHLQHRAFADEAKTPEGSTGDVLSRNSPGLQNAVFHATLTWSHDALLELEDQLLIPIRGDNPVELGVSDGLVEEVLARFDDDADYHERFARAFPGAESGATIQKIVFSLASFCRALLGSDSPYDRYRRGDKSALSDSARRGLGLFNGERFECFHCHAGANLTVSYRDLESRSDTLRYPFFNNGLYNVGGDGSYPAHDQGLYDLTFDRGDRGLFRPQSLRNVALTAPYMHDGSLATLRDVVEHYARGGTVTETGPFAGDGRVNPLKSGLVRGFVATEEEIDDLVAFLESLTDQSFIDNTAFTNPTATDP